MKFRYAAGIGPSVVAGANGFELAMAVATALFGVASGAALPTVVNVLTEVPIMLFLVWVCRKTRAFFCQPQLQYPGGK